MKCLDHEVIDSINKQIIETGGKMDEEIDQLKPHEIDEAQAMYRASKRENTMNDICRGAFHFLKLEPNNPDRKYWEEVTRKQVK